MQVADGKPYPLGATLQPGGVNFALFSAHAQQVWLVLFDEQDYQISRIALPQRTRQIWHGLVEGIGVGQRYGFEVEGPYQPQLGHRFNPAKLLLDPYARQLTGAPDYHPALFGYPREQGDDRLLCDMPSASHMPKCVVCAPLDRREPRPPRPTTSLRELVIYECHVKGMTANREDIPPHQRGTFAGLASRPVLDYLCDLGVNCVELLPVQAFFTEAFLHDKGLTNYWGYNSIGYFAPHNAYLSDGDIREFRHMVDAFHARGIKVILDVVYNHSAEGDHLGPTYSFRGIDNASYYRLHPNDGRFYINDTGCGNTLNLSHPRVLQMVMDSLRYWYQEMGVDGFRFDLAVCLGRESAGYDPRSGLFDAILQDPNLQDAILIAEPWDIGPGGYQLGNFPVNFSEWNDRYRDVIRRFWRGDSAMLAEFARRFHGSGDIFEHAGRPPASSINYVCSHDGFTLWDLVSYETRHNEANGEHNQDGHSENISANYGVEGVTDDPAILAVRRRQVRNMLTTLLFSQGVPMLLAGDERLNSQQGNNNAYCQDNPLGWLNWQESGDEELYGFVQRLIAIRKSFPLLCHSRYIHTPQNPNDPGLFWFNVQGQPMTKSDWGAANSATLSLLLSGDLRNNGQRGALLLMLNADSRERNFQLPQLSGVTQWQTLLSTQPAPLAQVSAGRHITLIDRSLWLMTANFSGESHE
ncbi:glycogen debranching protein GlgX [Bowmanella sp. JS7-9]|uniref:glycogen debranching protein GlgX n=1 Tax=Alteromonadaceae TaxID=72275 RepID=UPI00103DF88F|nr:glycogen debranching protein GlgX [Bowmanella sp. JS7-9]